MTITFYIHPGSGVQYSEPVIECASKLSRCDVLVVSDYKFEGCINISATEVEKAVNELYPETVARQVDVLPDHYLKSCFMHYLCMSIAIEHAPSLPILMFDWDMVCCGDVTGLESWLGEKSVYYTTAPFLVRDKGLLRRFAEWSGKRDRPRCAMDFWKEFIVSEYPDDHGILTAESIPYIDFNVHTHTEVWEENPDIVFAGLPAKNIHWVDGRPYFRRKKEGWLYPAHLIHCWGAYKGRIGELTSKLLS